MIKRFVTNDCSLAGFQYRQIAKRLRSVGFVFDRQAAGSHEIWYNEKSDKYTTIPNHPGDMPEGTLRRSSNKPISYLTLF
jgi:predicted RNA binding protein YcfA (HicA-like mRNA interferase family)